MKQEIILNHEKAETSLLKAREDLLSMALSFGINEDVFEAAVSVLERNGGNKFFRKNGEQFEMQHELEVSFGTLSVLRRYNNNEIDMSGVGRLFQQILKGASQVDIVRVFLVSLWHDRIESCFQYSEKEKVYEVFIEDMKQCDVCDPQLQGEIFDDIWDLTHRENEKKEFVWEEYLQKVCASGSIVQLVKLEDFSRNLYFPNHSIGNIVKYTKKYANFILKFLQEPGFYSRIETKVFAETNMEGENKFFHDLHRIFICSNKKHTREADIRVVIEGVLAEIALVLQEKTNQEISLLSLKTKILQKLEKEI